jgi:hypothetical protein
MLRSLAIAGILAIPAFGAAAPPSLDEALNRLYDFDFQATHDILNRYIAAHPNAPVPYAFRASAYLFFELDRMGILESEFLTDDERIAANRKRIDPDPEVRELLFRALGDTERRAQAVLDDNPNNRDALFAMCIAHGVATDYTALVEKRQFSSLSPAKRSNSYAQRLLKIDPTFYDAYLTAGFSEYMVGSLPFFVRWFVRFENVSGNKERGKQNLQLVAGKGRYFKDFAKILLGIIHLREKKPREAQKLLVDLSRDYPENPLFRKELHKLNRKLGDAAAPSM